MKLDFSEYGKDEENREAVKKALEEKNELFREIVELYDNVRKEERGPGMIIVAPLERMPSSKIKAVIESVIDREIETAAYPVVVEPLKTIYHELHQIKGTAGRKFKISDETREYLSKHPEIKLYRAKVREEWFVRRSLRDEISEKNYYLFDTDEKELGSRIQERQEYIHLSRYTPVRFIHIDVLETEELDLKRLDELVD
jgi:hypothetical protein